MEEEKARKVEMEGLKRERINQISAEMMFDFVMFSWCFKEYSDMLSKVALRFRSRELTSLGVLLFTFVMYKLSINKDQKNTLLILKVFVFVLGFIDVGVMIFTVLSHELFIFMIDIVVTIYIDKLVMYVMVHVLPKFCAPDEGVYFYRAVGIAMSKWWNSDNKLSFKEALVTASFEAEVELHKELREYANSKLKEDNQHTD